MADFDPTTSEVWYPIPGFPGYSLSSHLRLRGLYDVRKWAVKGKGYVYALLRRDGRYRIVYLHHLVAELAHGPRPDGLYVLHKDDDRANNWPSNLYYGTQTQNRADSKRNGCERCPRGTGRSNAILTDDIVREMRRLAASGMNQCAIGRKLGYDNRLVNAVVNRRRWAHVV